MILRGEFADDHRNEFRRPIPGDRPSTEPAVRPAQPSLRLVHGRRRPPVDRGGDEPGARRDPRGCRGGRHPGSIVRSAVERGCDPIIAAGGDGTVSTVADVLVGTEAHLVVFPLGTANVLARELGIPVELEGACRLGANHLHREMVAGREARGHSDRRDEDRRDVTIVTQVGVGIDSLMIRDTGTEQKRRFGRLAYLTTAASRLIGFRPRTVHDHRRRPDVRRQSHAGPGRQHRDDGPQRLPLGTRHLRR